MRTLYHHVLSPASRAVRLVLTEKALDFGLEVERDWERRPEFLALNPAGEVPVLVESDGTVIATGSVIAEYLDEVYRERLLIGLNPVERAEVRRLVVWFDVKMDREVTRNLTGEKLLKRISGQGQPNSAAIRAGHSAVRFPPRLHRLSDGAAALAGRRSFLAGRHLRGSAAFRARLFRRRPLGRSRGGKGLVRAHQVAPQLPPAPERPYRRLPAAQTLRRPRLLGVALRQSAGEWFDGWGRREDAGPRGSGHLRHRRNAGRQRRPARAGLAGDAGDLRPSDPVRRRARPDRKGRRPAAADLPRQGGGRSSRQRDRKTARRAFQGGLPARHLPIPADEAAVPGA